MSQNNPFAVQTPESLSAQSIVDLFVGVFSDFPKVLSPGHTFLHGPRGSGKSMMFRYLEPDCQDLVSGASPLKERSFFGVYLPIKLTDLNVVELAKLERRHAAIVLNEHLLTCAVAARTFAALRKVALPPDVSAELRELLEQDFSRLLAAAGGKHSVVPLGNSADETLGTMQRACDEMYIEATRYLRRLAFSEQLGSYSGPLVGYLDFMVPLVRHLRRLSFMPRGPIYLLIDDADNLTETQTRILNSWVSYRTTAEISLKISTQLRYKTYQTVLNDEIDAPHDYSAVNISAVYTSSKNKYRERVAEIVSKRLGAYGYGENPEAFFPVDAEQEAKVAAIAEELRANWPELGRGFRASDDATRYARPMYIASLRGTRKSGHTYRYAGFDQLVHLSDGIIRHFLESASYMFAEAVSRTARGRVNAIPASIQDITIRSMADAFRGECVTYAIDRPEKDLHKLTNLVDALGGLFGEILKTDRLSDRRVFSVALTDRPGDELQRILDLGVELGYLHRSVRGNKEGTGKTDLYVLTRRLAPVYSLDPTSFAGYQFIQSDVLAEALYKPQALIRRVKKLGATGVFSSIQRSFFEEAT